MDNVSVHKVAGVEDAIEARGAIPFYLPAYSPDYNGAEELWKWLRDEVTANTCFGTAAHVAAAVWEFLLGLNDRLDEVKQRCRSELQTAAFPETSQHPERRTWRLEQRRQRTVQATLAM